MCPTPFMLRFQNLCKRYGEHILFQALAFDTGTGCIALNDQSGSGKSTLLGMLAGEIEVDEGDVWIGGHSLRSEPARARASLAYIPDDCMPSAQMTGRAFLDQVAASRGCSVDDHALALADRFGLGPHLEKRFEQMSFGTRKKMVLTAAALGKPAVVIADEPASGLDAPARAALVDLFKTFATDRTVLFSSYDPELAQACHARTIGFADLRN